MKNALRVGDLLRRIKDDIAIDDTSTYSRLTIRMAGKGVALRDRVAGAAIGTKRQFVAKVGQFVLSKIDARNGAFGIVPIECDNAIVTGNFWVFDIDSSRIESRYFQYLTSTPSFAAACFATSGGTTNRRYLQEDAFLRMPVALPPLAEQRAIIAHLDALANKTRQLTKRLDDITADADELIRSYLFGNDAKGYRKRKMSDLAQLQVSDVTVDGLQRYRFAGVYSFGRGVFASANKAGSDFAYERLSTVRTGDFIYPKLMAWEGALGVVPAECDGMVVSPEFPVFRVDTDAILPEILDIYFRTPAVWPELAALSGGTNVRRRRLQPSAFLNYEMPVPPMPTQLKIRELRRTTQALKARHALIRASNTALLPATLERLFG